MEKKAGADFGKILCIRDADLAESIPGPFFINLPGRDIPDPVPEATSCDGRPANFVSSPQRNAKESAAA